METAPRHLELQAVSLFKPSKRMKRMCHFGPFILIYALIIQQEQLEHNEGKIQSTLSKDFPKVQIFRLHRLHYSDLPTTLLWTYMEQLTPNNLNYIVL